MEDAAAFLGEILPDDTHESTECVSELLGVALGLVGVDIHVGGCGGQIGR